MKNKKTVRGWWLVMPGVFFGGTYEQHQAWLKEIARPDTPEEARLWEKAAKNGIGESLDAPAR